MGVVLVGAPGSGKTTVARALAERYGFRYLDREARLLEAYGSLEAFVARKEAAVREMQREALEWMAEEESPWIYESTALTERDFVLRLMEAEGGFGVRLGVSLKEALARVAARATGKNLSNDLQMTRRVWEACEATHDDLPFALRIGTGATTADEVAGEVHRAFKRWWADSGPAAP